MPRGCTNVYLRPVSYFSLFLTLCTAMVSMCTSDWYHWSDAQTANFEQSLSSEGDSDRVLMGLWNVNLFGDCKFMPSDRNDISSDMMKAIRVLFSMGIMMLLGAICYPPLYKQMSTEVIKIEVMAIFTAGGGACIFISMMMITHAVNSLPTSHTYVDQGVAKHLKNPTFGYSFILGWCTMGMCIATACLIYVASKGNVYIEKAY